MCGEVPAGVLQVPLEPLDAERVARKMDGRLAEQLDLLYANGVEDIHIEGLPIERPVDGITTKLHVRFAGDLASRDGAYEFFRISAEQPPDFLGVIRAYLDT